MTSSASGSHIAIRIPIILKILISYPKGVYLLCDENETGVLMGDNRIGKVERKTNETDIRVEVNLNGSGTSDISTGIGFFDHMLTHVAKHGLLDLTVKAAGDLHIDDHHTVEDVGIGIGKALDQALGDRVGIVRYGHSYVPMDEALALCALDISGRGLCVCSLAVPVEKIGEFATEMVPEFFRAMAHNSGITLHLHRMTGSNGHHIVEAAFKAFGRALADAVAVSDRVIGVPSTKGMI
jgi:imidazoleglycerol-phosphate dehydratase